MYRFLHKRHKSLILFNRYYSTIKTIPNLHHDGKPLRFHKFTYDDLDNVVQSWVFVKHKTTTRTTIFSFLVLLDFKGGVSLDWRNYPLFSFLLILNFVDKPDFSLFLRGHCLNVSSPLVKVFYFTSVGQTNKDLNIFY